LQEAISLEGRATEDDDDEETMTAKMAGAPDNAGANLKIINNNK
jgi:hypothetical protein